MTTATILFVDNNPLFLQSRKELLAREGYQVLTATSSAQAKHILSETHIDLALLDLRLTDDNDDRDYSGLMLAREIARALPTIMLSAFPDIAAVRNALRPSVQGDAPALDFLDKTESFAELLAVVRRVLSSKKVMPIARWHVPHRRNPYFLDQTVPLAVLRTALTSGSPNARTQVICGIAGVGKTALALEYVYRHAHEYTVVWWIRAEMWTTLVADYIALAQALQLPEQVEREQTRSVAAVRRWLEDHDNWLLIFDNAPEPKQLRDCLPSRATGHILVTSRNPQWSRLTPVYHVRGFDSHDAVTFLLRRTNQADAAAAAALAVALEYLPLALEQAAASCNARHLSLAAYREQLTLAGLELLRRGKPATAYPNTVVTTWTLAFHSLQQESPVGADLLTLCAFLAPTEIPLALLQEHATAISATFTARIGEPLAWTAALAALQRYSLVEMDDQSLRVHPMMQALMRDHLRAEGTDNKWAEMAVELLSHAFPVEEDAPCTGETWATCARLLPHAQVAASITASLQVAAGKTAHLLNQVGLYLQARAQLVEAQLAFEQALTISETTYGGQHPGLVIYALHLGRVLRGQGQLTRARAVCERALALSAALEGQKQDAVAIAVSNLGLLLRDLGDLPGAQAACARALTMIETAYGSTHAKMGVGLHNLGSVLHDLGDLPGARIVYERALGINEALYGPAHVAVASTLSTLGVVLLAQGDFLGAHEACERALVIQAVEYGPEDARTVHSLRSVGNLYRLRGQPQQALPYYEQTLAISHKIGDRSMEGQTLHALGIAYNALGDRTQANSFYQQALVIARQHQDLTMIADILIALGRLACDDDHLDQASQYWHESRTIYRQLQHPLEASVGSLLTTLDATVQEHQHRRVYAEFFSLWHVLPVDDMALRVRRFCDLFAGLTAAPLQSYQPVPEKQAYLGIFDLAAVFQDLFLPFVPHFPILFLVLERLTDESSMHIRHLLRDYVGASNRSALLVPFCSDATFLEVKKNLAGGATRQAHAYDLICLSHHDLSQIITSADPRNVLRRTILAQVDLTRLPLYNTAGSTPAHMFFGREQELKELCYHAHTANYIVIGGRRIGKTSILKRLGDVLLPDAGFRALYHDCSVTSPDVVLLDTLLVNKSWFPQPLPQPPASLLTLFQALPDDKPLVILLDEADKLLEPEPQTAHRIFNTFRALSNDARCRFILCGEHRLRAELTNVGSPLYNFGNLMIIGRLERPAMAELVTQPMKRLDITLDDEAAIVECIWDFTSGHPSVVQSLCHRLIKRLNQRDDHCLTLEDVEAVIGEPDFMRSDFLGTYFSRASVLEHLCALLMAVDPQLRTLLALYEIMRHQELAVSLNQVDGALERLVDLRSILQRTPDGYDFAVTAFPRVIGKTRRVSDLIALRQEIYRGAGDIDPDHAPPALNGRLW